MKDSKGLDWQGLDGQLEGHNRSHEAFRGAEGAPENAALYVDLDGTLVATDTLWELLFTLLREQPALLLRLPFWLARGRAALKAQVAAHASLDPARLPYRSEVLERLRLARDAGRRVVLATGSDERVARAVADHLQLFDGVLASDGERNLTARRKLDAIVEDAGGAFAYAGDSRDDLTVWRRSARAILVAPSRIAETRVAALGISSELWVPAPSRAKAVWQALRPYQWSKNLLLGVPLLLAHELGDPARWWAVAITFACFCAIASGTYLVNDLLDLEADRHHPRKRERPLASGALSLGTGLRLAVGLIAGSLVASLLLLPAACSAMLGVYLALTLAYSMLFKAILVLDVMVLAGLYTLRLLTGGVAASVAISPWLLAFSTFFFLSLALLKRYVELAAAQDGPFRKLARRGYNVGDLSLVQTMGLTSGYVSVLVLCLYVSSDAVTRLYRTPELVWAVSPVMLYWITRVWFLARRGKIPDDPVLFAASDRTSYAVAAIVLAIGWWAAR